MALSRAGGKDNGNVVFVLGAGVDRVLGLPLLNTIFRDLATFAKGPGKAINAAMRLPEGGRRSLRAEVKLLDITECIRALKTFVTRALNGPGVPLN